MPLLPFFRHIIRRCLKLCDSQLAWYKWQGKRWIRKSIRQFLRIKYGWKSEFGFVANARKWNIPIFFISSICFAHYVCMQIIDSCDTPELSTLTVIQSQVIVYLFPQSPQKSLSKASNIQLTFDLSFSIRRAHTQWFSWECEFYF